MDGVVLGRPGIEAAGELLTLQRAAFLAEGQRAGTPFLPPLTETLTELVAALPTVLAARLGHRLVGAVRATEDGDTLHVGRLAVAPDLQGRGLGSLLLRAAEELAGPGVRRYALFTGADSAANIRLYTRLGYRPTRTGTDALGIEVVHLVKPRG